MEENDDENEQRCSKCKQYRDLDWFKPGRTQCNQCLEAKKRYREKHKEQLSNYFKAYYQEHKEEIKAKIKNLYTDCFYCKCPVHEYRMKQHINSNKHQKLMIAFHNKNTTEIK